MAEKPLTRAQLAAELDKIRAEHTAQRQRADRAEASERETRAQFGDLKERLALAEADNQRMRGYIARVQEDDVVREELIATGDPEGEQHLVPKRRPTRFDTPSSYTHSADGCGSGGAASGLYHDRVGRDRPPPQHWVRYGERA